jgi:hypothetical protein
MPPLNPRLGLNAISLPRNPPHVPRCAPRMKQHPSSIGGVARMQLAELSGSELSRCGLALHGHRPDVPRAVHFAAAEGHLGAVRGKDWCPDERRVGQQRPVDAIRQRVQQHLVAVSRAQERNQAVVRDRREIFRPRPRRRCLGSPRANGHPATSPVSSGRDRPATAAAVLSRPCHPARCC